MSEEKQNRDPSGNTSTQAGFSGWPGNGTGTGIWPGEDGVPEYGGRQTGSGVVGGNENIGSRRMIGSRRRDAMAGKKATASSASAAGAADRERPGTRMDQSVVGSREMKRYEDEKMSRYDTSRSRSLPASIFQWAFQILLMIILAWLLVWFFGQRRTNIGPSMDTTLSGGDEVLVNILSYQMGGPARGDVISFKPNGSASGRCSIKRVVALPGETIQIIDGMIYIDGKVLLEQKDYPVMNNPGMAEDPIYLKEGQYFVLGDNRNNSEDSRFAQVGLVDSSMIEGKVWFILSPGSRRGFLKE